MQLLSHHPTSHQNPINPKPKTDDTFRQEPGPVVKYDKEKAMFRQSTIRKDI